VFSNVRNGEKNMSYQIIGDRTIAITGINFRQLQKNLGEAFAFILVHQGKTETDLAKLLDNTRQYVNWALKGNLGLKTIFRIADILNVKVKIIFEF
jgi:hypothetical protein